MENCRPAQAQLVRLSLMNMVDTCARVANAHGPAFGHSIFTGGPLPCEAPSVNKKAAPESSETFIAPTLPQDSSQGFLFSRQVQSALHFQCIIEISRKFELICQNKYLFK